MINKSDSPFDQLASVYDGWFEGEGRLIFATEVRALRKILALLPKPWLEVGVGSGRFAQALGIPIGVDPSARLLEMARKRGINSFLGRGEEGFFRDASFGTIFLIVTLCFVSSPLAVLREAHRTLKRDGKVVLGLVLRESPWGEFYQVRKKEGDPFYRHATLYSYQEVVGLLEEAGFALERVLSTLFQKPNQVTQVEAPREHFSPEAGFTVMVAGKRQP